MADLVFPGKPAGGPINSTAMPSSYDLVIYKGDYVELYVTLKDSTGTVMNLTGYTANARMRKDFTSTTYYDFTVTIPTPTNGKVKVYMSSAISKTIPAGDYIWGFSVVNPSNDERTYLAGDVTVTDEVT